MDLSTPLTSLVQLQIVLEKHKKTTTSLSVVETHYLFTKYM